MLPLPQASAADTSSAAAIAVMDRAPTLIPTHPPRARTDVQILRLARSTKFEGVGDTVALNAYLRLVGEKSGEIHGSVIQKGREGKILVIAASHGVVTPRGDPASGQAAGKRQHQPFVITKPVDRSSVPLHQVQAANERFREWELQFWAPQLKASTGTGAELQHFTVKLTNASIASIAMQMPNTTHPDLVRLDTFEEVAFTYQAIEWTWTDGGIVASDDWGV